jgi:hypothetical protein
MNQITPKESFHTILYFWKDSLINIQKSYHLSDDECEFVSIALSNYIINFFKDVFQSAYEYSMEEYGANSTAKTFMFFSYNYNNFNKLSKTDIDIVYKLSNIGVLDVICNQEDQFFVLSKNCFSFLSRLEVNQLFNKQEN